MVNIKHDLIKKDSIEARLYQEVLVSRIIEKGNSLVVAPTALGKTIVGVMLAAHKLKEKKESKILFLAPTKPLVVQHEKSFKKFLNINKEDIVSITGTTKPQEREEIYKTKKIINATPQTIENDLLNGRISLKDFELVIFDEAHRAIGDYAYVFINLQLQKHNSNCLVVALTASPGSEEEKIQDVCRNLSIKNIEVKNAEDKDVKPYVNEIEIDWVKVELPPKFREVKSYLEEFQKKQLKILKQMRVAQTENKNYYNRIRLLEMQRMLRTRIQNGNNPSLYLAISRSAAMLKVAHAEELVDTQGIGALNNYFNKVLEEAAKGKSKAAKSIVSDPDIKKAIAVTQDLFEQNVQHPKYAELKKIIKAQFAEKPKSKIIVFNHYRDSIREVVKFLKEDKTIKATRFIGQATKGAEKGMSQKLQEETLQNLRDGKYNVLVASSVAEEGLDIPSVELVVFFEPVPSEIRTIQRRGRTGRAGKGKNIILMAKGTRDEAFYWAAKGKENKMKTTLKRMKDDNNMLPQQKTLGSFTEEKRDEIIIFVDSREQASSVTKELFEKDCKIIMKQLDVGDYILSKDVCIERKTVEDFLSSMIDGRLFSQMINMRENYEKPLILVEGNMDELFTLRNIHKNSVIGALTSIALDYNVPILNTKSARETAHYLFVIAKREQIAREKEVAIRIGRKGLTVNEQQRFVVEGLPLVGPSLARNLLNEFGSIKSIIDADEKDLQKAEGLGKGKAKKIHKLLNAKFKDERDKVLDN
jgi:ERCC4-related helicase